MLKFIDCFQVNNIVCFVLFEVVVCDFVEYKDYFMQCIVWVDQCCLWYKGCFDGFIFVLWFGFMLYYIEVLMNVCFDDFEFKYFGNCFVYFGNGYSRCEVDQIVDWVWYICERDDDQLIIINGCNRLISKSGIVIDCEVVGWSGDGSQVQVKIQIFVEVK